MLKTNISLLFLFILQNSYSQPYLNNHIEYYNLCNEADRFLYKNEYLNAHKKYIEAFEKVEYPHAKYLVKTAKLSKKLKYYDLEKKFFKEALLRGESPKIILKNLSFKNRSFKDSIDLYAEKHQKSINNEYKYILDSLHFLDQKVIRGNNWIKGNYKIDYFSLPQNIYSLDDSIFNSLLKAINKFGFPFEHTVGKSTFQNISIIFHHNFRLPSNEIHFNIIEAALKNGACLPDTFAWLYDQKTVIYQRKEPYFYYAIASTKHLTLEERKVIDSRRQEKGIKPLEAYRVKARKSGIDQREVW